MPPAPALISRDDVEAAVEAVIAALPTEAHRSAARAELARRVDEASRRASMGRWRDDGVAWTTERLRVDLWSKQREIKTALRDHKRVAVKSCNAAGKSFSAADIVAWWCDAHPPESVFAITTAPSFPQVRAVLWREIRRLHRRGGLTGRVNQTEWMDDNDDIIAYGRKPADTDTAGFLGTHALYPLIVIDEAGGVPRTLFDAAESIATNDNARILAIGNPDDPSGAFAEACRSPLWHVITISAYDTPNLTGEPVSDELRQLLVTKQWVEERGVAWGVDNPLYISRVLGEFPVDAPTKVVRLGDLVECRIPPDTPHDPDKMLPIVLGVDIGEGRDLTVIRERRGIVAGRTWSHVTPEEDGAADAIVDAIEVTGATVVNIDAGGPGWAIGGLVEAKLKTARREKRPVPDHVIVNRIKFGAKSREPDKYMNVRAELWWGIGRMFSQEHAWDLSELDKADFENVSAQLVDPDWHMGAGDRIVIESKAEIRLRTGRSPDDADALVLAFLTGVATGPAKISRPTGQLPRGTQIARR